VHSITYTSSKLVWACNHIETTHNDTCI